MRHPELEYATEEVAQFLRDLVRLDSVGLLEDAQLLRRVEAMESGYLARAARSLVLDAIKYGQEHPRAAVMAKLVPPVPPPIADLLEPERRPESTSLQPVRAPGPPPLPGRNLLPRRPPPLPLGVSPSARPTAPPPAGWDPGETTPLKPLDDYPQIEMSEMDFSDADTAPQTPRAKHAASTPTARTIPSWPAPPPSDPRPTVPLEPSPRRRKPT